MSTTDTTPYTYEVQAEDAHHWKDGTKRVTIYPGIAYSRHTLSVIEDGPGTYRARSTATKELMDAVVAGVIPGDAQVWWVTLPDGFAEKAKAQKDEPTMPDDVDDLKALVAVLRRQGADLRQELDATERRHKKDIATIGQALLSEAEERDWCSEYDDVVRSLNDELCVELPVRSMDATLDFLVTVSIDGATGDLLQRIQAGDYSWIRSSFSFEVDGDGDVTCNYYGIAGVELNDASLHD